LYIPNGGNTPSIKENSKIVKDQQISTIIDKEVKNEKDISKNSVNYFVNCSFFDNKNKEIDLKNDDKNIEKDDKK
jgi:hypothetical protein